MHQRPSNQPVQLCLLDGEERARHVREQSNFSLCRLARTRLLTGPSAALVYDTDDTTLPVIAPKDRDERQRRAPGEILA